MSVNVGGEYFASIDSKGKIAIPKGFVLEDNVEVAYVKFNDLYFDIYPLEKLLEFINILKAKKQKGMKIEDYNAINRKIRILYASIIDTYKMDTKRKLLLPRKIIQEIPDKRVLLQGINLHISMCPTQESYDELCKLYIPQNFGIKKF